MLPAAYRCPSGPVLRAARAAAGPARRAHPGRRAGPAGSAHAVGTTTCTVNGTVQRAVVPGYTITNPDGRDNTIACAAGVGAGDTVTGGAGGKNTIRPDRPSGSGPGNRQPSRTVPVPASSSCVRPHGDRGPHRLPAGSALPDRGLTGPPRTESPRTVNANPHGTTGAAITPRPGTVRKRGDDDPSRRRSRAPRRVQHTAGGSSGGCRARRPAARPCAWVLVPPSRCQGQESAAAGVVLLNM